jgi:hypothetical protein
MDLSICPCEGRMAPYSAVGRVARTASLTYDSLHKGPQGWREGKHDPHRRPNAFWGVLIAA